ncbi:MDR family MFS transporter [Spelaeicoccus albus]|uniref:EmrB/QacA subfamily drug resistance transporter n=1 Tax=Spelaeicoccus albus TaxID=1280376 RepID=A0A7Z0D1Y9_9MICO|nr:MDR family MFS transporter [Spelaeicoccus albus]NYI67257.1 EmrB/QacA subfamily drug resistance transporter [Spelaeicoccus albus]
MTSTKPQEPESTSQAIPRKRLITIFIGLILGILMAALDQTIVATALPTIAGQLDGLELISWIITAYLLGQAVAMPLYGKVGDYIGRRNSFHLAILIFLGGSIVAGLSQSMEMLIVFRAVQGIGAGGLMIGAQTIMAAIVNPRERAKYMSVMGPMIGVATVLGPLLGGYLTQHVNWRWIFYINVPIGAAALIVTAITLKLPREATSKKVDYWGSLFMAAAITCLMLMLTWGGRRYDWTSPTILWLIAGAVVFTPVWLWIEHKTSEPILPLHLFRDPVFKINAPLAFILGVAMFGAVSYLPTYLQLSRGASATTSGLLMLPLMGGLMAAAVTTGQLISRTGRYKVFPIVGTALAAVGMYLLSLMDASTGEWVSGFYMAILGFGIGLIMPTLVLTVQNSVAHHDVGPATAGVNFFRQVGASFGTALIGSLFVGRLTDELAKNMPAGAASKIGQHATGITPDELAKLPVSLAHDVVISYADALIPLYRYLVPLLVVGFILVWFIKEIPLTLTRGGPPRPGDDAPSSAHESAHAADRVHHGAHAADVPPDLKPHGNHSAGATNTDPAG